jgi:hypothetical protein
VPAARVAVAWPGVPWNYKSADGQTPIDMVKQRRNNEGTLKMLKQWRNAAKKKAKKKKVEVDEKDL